MSPLSSYVFRNLLGKLGTDRVAAAFDTPGFGMSDAPEAPPEIEDYARITQEVIAALGMRGPVDVLGYHTGSITAVELARRSPRLVRRVVMISAPVLDAEERAKLATENGPQPLSEDGSHLMKGWQRFAEFNKGPGVTLQALADLYPERLLGRSRSWWGHRAAFNYDLAAALPKVRHPILVLNPRDDLWTITPRAGPLLRNGRIVDLPDWGHGFLDSFTTPAARLIRGFLDTA